MRKNGHIKQSKNVQQIIIVIAQHAIENSDFNLDSHFEKFLKPYTLA